MNVDSSTHEESDDIQAPDQQHVTFVNTGFQIEGKTDEREARSLEDGKEVNEGPVTVEQDATESLNSSTCRLLPFARLKLLQNVLQKHRQVLTRCVVVVLVLLYLAYTGYALYRQWGTESATRLWLVLAIVLWLCGGGHVFRLIVHRLGQAHVHPAALGRFRRITRWFLYLAAVAGAVVYLALEVAPHHPNNLISLAGMAVLVLVGLLLSTQPDRVNWHAVFWGLSLQFYLALFILRTQAGGQLFDWLGRRFQEFIAYTDEGSKFLFGDAYIKHPFVFKTMPVILFMSVIISIGYHIGAVQAIIASFGRLLAWCLDTTPIESVNAAANVFMSHAEAPLFTKPFLDHVTESELFAIMAGGFASMSGGISAVVIDFGIPANHILAASVMSAPAALAVAKLMCPEKPGTTRISAQDVYKVDIGKSANLLEAVSKAAMTGVTVVVRVCATISVFIALLAFADRTLEWFGDQAGLEDFTISRLLAYLFYPLMYVCGVDTQDLLSMGRLVGTKIITSTLVGYRDAAILISNSRTFSNYTTLTNGTWHHHGFDVVLDDWNQTLVGGVLTDRSIVMSTYILCGLCNVSSCGICIGTLTALAPKRTPHVLKHVVWACVAGNIACFLTGCLAGLLHR